MHTHSLSIHPDSGRALRPWELALLLAVCVTLLTGTWAQARSQLLAARLVRLHVIAVSDDDTEQAVKLQVRDAVLAYLGPQLADVTDIDAAEQLIAGDLDGIARAAQAAAGERPVRVTLGPEHYPTRDYGTFALPAGVYTSLRVTLGAGAGHNWWCVIFPPLCAQAAGLSEQAVQALSDDDVRLVTESGGGYVVRFRLLELWDALVQRLSGRRGAQMGQTKQHPIPWDRVLFFIARSVAVHAAADELAQHALGREQGGVDRLEALERRQDAADLRIALRALGHGREQGRGVILQNGHLARERRVEHQIRALLERGDEPLLAAAHVGPHV